jgi:hypothetical protein
MPPSPSPSSPATPPQTIWRAICVPMESRAVIAQAKGIIMLRDHCTVEEDFDMLRHIFQQQNVKSATSPKPSLRHPEIATSI